MNLVGGLPGLRKRGIKWTRQHINRLERQDKFPKRIRVGENTVDWIEEEIDGWIAERVAQRDGKAA